jgi:hypothetical protein
MRLLFQWILALLMLLTVDLGADRGPWFLIGRGPTPPSVPSTWLVQNADLNIIGSFRAPNTGNYGYSGWGLTYNAAGNGGQGSLLLISDQGSGKVCEMDIPTPVYALNDLTPLPRAHSLTDCNTPYFDGLQDVISSGDSWTALSSMFAYNNKIYLGGYKYYAAGDNYSYVVKNSPILGTTGNSSGPYRVGNYSQTSISGFMARVPAAWRSALGGPVVAGGTVGVTIITRGSVCPTLYSLDPDTITTAMPYASTIALAECPDADHDGMYSYNSIPGTTIQVGGGIGPIIGRLGNANPLFNVRSAIGGVIVGPQNSRSVLFFGTTGLGTDCYGDPQVPADNCPDNEDPNSKGDHNPPYVPYMWAYDINDLEQVKLGNVRPTDVRPYAYWQLWFPFCTFGKADLIGVAENPITGDIYTAQKRACSDDTVINVYRVTRPTP